MQCGAPFCYPREAATLSAVRYCVGFQPLDTEPSTPCCVLSWHSPDQAMASRRERQGGYDYGVVPRLLHLHSAHLNPIPAVSSLLVPTTMCLIGSRVIPELEVNRRKARSDARRSNHQQKCTPTFSRDSANFLKRSRTAPLDIAGSRDGQVQLRGRDGDFCEYRGAGV